MVELFSCRNCVHKGLENLMWATDQLNGALTTLDWRALRHELDAKALEWTEQIIQHATSENAFFPTQPQWEDTEESESL